MRDEARRKRTRTRREGRGGKEGRIRTKSPLVKSHPTTTSTFSLFKKSTISPSPCPSTTAPSILFLTKGDNVGKAVRETSGFKDWI
jgi:hypothetical protein